MERHNAWTYIEFWEQIQKCYKYKKGASLRRQGESDSLPRDVERLLKLANSKPLNSFASTGQRVQDLNLFVQELVNGNQSRLTEKLTDTWYERVDRVKDAWEDELRKTDFGVFSSGNIHVLESDFLTPLNLFRFAVPKLAWHNLEDARSCFNAEVPTAAVSLGLQAVEATLRYFYIRHGGQPDSRDNYYWQNMVDRLAEQKAINSECKEKLTSLGRYHRNTVAHAQGRYSPERSKEVLRDCIRGLSALLTNAHRQDCLKVSLKISTPPRPNFDTVVAAYLFWQSPRMPPLDRDCLEIALSRNSALEDVNLPYQIPNATSSSSLAGQMLDHPCLKQKTDNRIPNPGIETLVALQSSVGALTQHDVEEGDMTTVFRALRFQKLGHELPDDELNGDPNIKDKICDLLIVSFGALDEFIARDNLHNLRGRTLAEEIGIGEAWKSLECAYTAQQQGNPIYG